MSLPKIYEILDTDQNGDIVTVIENIKYYKEMADHEQIHYEA